MAALSVPIVLFVFLVGWVWALIDALRKEREYFWVVLLVLAPPVGLAGYVLNFLILGDTERGLGAARHRSERRQKIEDLRGDKEALEIPANREELARLLFEEGDYEEALSELKRLLDTDPENLQAQYLAARCLLGLSKFEAARPHLEYVVEESPSYDGGLAALRHALLLERLGDWKAALAVYERARDNLALTETRYHHARVLAEHGRAREARDILRNIVEHDEGTPQFRAGVDEQWVRSARKLLTRLDGEGV